LLTVKLNHNHGYKWFCQDEIYVKGYLFDNDNNLLENEKLVNYFLEVGSEEEFKDKLIEANGIFSVLIKRENILFIAVDRTRTFPIFYTVKDEKIYISDDTYYLQDKVKNHLDNDSSEEFLSTGYVTGKETLIKDIFQVQAGEYLIYKNKTIVNNFYFDYLTTKVSTLEYDFLKKDFIQILNNSIHRLIKLANGRKIVLPLSGGYDSRLIASLLKKHNYKNVLCFTYGSKESFEVSISKKVASELGFEWHFIEYNEETVPKDYPISKTFQEYYKFASNHVSIFLTQDYFAVKYLFDKEIIPSDSVIVPGHSGDFLGGSHLAKTEVANKQNLVNIILKKHYLLHESNNIMKNKILEYFKDSNKNEQFFYSLDENFNLKERQSKFIVNANRVYEYFGYQHSIPLWDSELIEFFRILPLEYKLNSYFFEKVIIEDIFEPLNIGYKKEGIKSNKLKSKVKNFIKKVIPSSLKKQILHKIHIDFNNFYLIHNPLQEELNSTYLITEINSLLSKWYLFKVKDEKNT